MSLPLESERACDYFSKENMVEVTLGDFPEQVINEKAASTLVLLNTQSDSPEAVMLKRPSVATLCQGCPAEQSPLGIPNKVPHM